jgi:micrococcal nuclease
MNKQTINLLLGLALLVASPSQAEMVCSVRDGDTFKLCSGASIRIAGIDAPELKQPLGPESRDYLKRVILGRDVQLTCKGKSYQRQVCSVSKGSLDVQKEMVGWGWAYREPRYDKAGVFIPAEEFARRMGRGVWVVPEGGVKPWDFRHKRSIH